MESNNLVFRLTGGTGNTDPNASLGGAISNTVVSGALHGLFDYVSPEEAALVSPGDIEYRAIDVLNTHGTDTCYGAVAYISTPASPSGDNTIAVGYDSTGTQTIANEDTAPSAPVITFSVATSKATGVALGDIAPGATKRIWVRWTVISALKGLATAQIKVEGGSV